MNKINLNIETARMLMTEIGLANHYLTKVMNRSVGFICADHNEQVIRSSREAEDSLNLSNMAFICSDIKEIDIKEQVDIIYSLHACDTATDMMIAKGIQMNVQSILTVACCQKTFKDRIKRHPLNR